MSRSMTRMGWLALVLVSIVLAGIAEAAGLVIPAERLNEGDRQALLAQIEKARRDDPDAFERLEQSLRAIPMETMQTPDGWNARAATLGRGATSEYLYPFLEAVAVCAPEGLELDPKTLVEVQNGLIGGLRAMKDERALPVALAVLNAEDVAAMVRNQAGAAIGALDNPQAEAVLVGVLDDPASSYERTRAALLGLRTCRSLAVAQRVARFLEDPKLDDETAKVAVGVLAMFDDWGDGRSVRRAEDAPSACRVAAEAMARAFFVHRGPLARKAIAAALPASHYPGIEGLIEKVRLQGEPADQADIQHLERNYRGRLDYERVAGQSPGR